MKTPRPDDWDRLSLWEQMALLPPEEMDAAILEMVQNGVDLDDPEIRFRPTQLEVLSDEESWIILFNGARGTGKTRVGGAWVNKKAKDNPGCRIALVGRTVSDVRDTIVGGESGIIAYAPKDFTPQYTPSIRKLEWPNGSTAMTYCMTPETEALTRNGWRPYDDLKVGEDILTLNTETMLSEWQPVEEIHTFDVDEPLVRTKMKGHHSFCTVSHRWPTVNKTGNKLRWRESILDFNTKDAIIGAVPASNAVFPDTPTYSDAFVELIAWVTTEGHFTNHTAEKEVCIDRQKFIDTITARRKFLGWTRRDVEERLGWKKDRLRGVEKSGGGEANVRSEVARGLGISTVQLDECFSLPDRRQVVTITQNLSRCSSDIETALCSLYGPPKKSLANIREAAWRKYSTTRETGNIRNDYYLTHEVYESILPVFVGDPKDKTVSCEFISKLTRDQVSLFLDTCINADGSWRNQSDNGTSSSVITQKLGDRLDAIEFAAVLLGYSPRRSDAYFILNYEPAKIKPGVKNGPVKSRILDGHSLSITGAENEKTFRPNTSVRDVREMEFYRGVVWCPQTSNKTWVARHDGTVFYTGNSADSPSQLRGPQQHFTYCDELAAYPQKPDDSGATMWDQVVMSTRLGDNPQILATTTPKRVEVIKDLAARAQTEGSGVRLITGSTWDNRANLSREYIDSIYARYAGTHLERQELYGELIGDSEDALWNSPMIEYEDMPEDEELLFVIGVDPAVTVGNDDTGIVVVAADMNRDPYKRRAWVIDDYTMNDHVEKWAEVVLEVQAKWSRVSSNNPRGRPAIVVVEKDHGHDLLGVLFKNAGADLTKTPIVPISTRGMSKTQRAESIVLAYQQGRVKHDKELPGLETEMTGWEPRNTKGKSPGHIDALVHGLRTLLVDSRPIARWAPILVSDNPNYGEQTLGGITPAWKRDRGVKTGMGSAPWRH